MKGPEQGTHDAAFHFCPPEKLDPSENGTEKNLLKHQGNMTNASAIQHLYRNTFRSTGRKKKTNKKHPKKKG